MIIGITGGTGCGKTTLLEVVRELGGVGLDCDRIYHELLETDPTLLTRIARRFPGTVEQGTLQRKKLGSLVFADPAALEDLNRITHQAVYSKVAALLTPPPDLAAIDAIALFESGLYKLCRVTVAVTAPREARLQRIMARDGVTREYALQRVRAQQDDAFFTQRCDYTLENDSDSIAFRKKCLAFCRTLEGWEHK